MLYCTEQVLKSTTIGEELQVTHTHTHTHTRARARAHRERASLSASLCLSVSLCQATGEVRSKGRKQAQWVEVEWSEEQALEAAGQFAGTVTVRATGWVLTQADGVLFLEQSVYYNARK